MMNYVNFVPKLGIEKQLPLYVWGVGVGHTQEPIHSEEQAYFRIHLTISGCGIVHTRDGKTHLLPVGHMLYTPPFCEFNIEPAPSGWVDNWIAICVNTDSATVDLLGNEQRIFIPKNIGELIELYDRVNRELTESSVEGRFLAAADAYRLVCLVIAGLDGIDGSPAENRFVSRTLNYIEHHIAEKITLADLCNAGKPISPQYLDRIFKQRLGISPIEYLRRRRIEYSKKLLTNTSLPISEIAALSGFESESYFYRIWKRLEPIPPREWRSARSHLYE